MTPVLAPQEAGAQPRPRPDVWGNHNWSLVCSQRAGKRRLSWPGWNVRSTGGKWRPKALKRRRPWAPWSWEPRSWTEPPVWALLAAENRPCWCILAVFIMRTMRAWLAQAGVSHMYTMGATINSISHKNNNNNNKDYSQTYRSSDCKRTKVILLTRYIHKWLIMIHVSIAVWQTTRNHNALDQ